MSGKKRISLDDIARAAKVSRMTVSRALRGHPHVSSTVRKRILATAERLGYRPDARMSELMAMIRSSQRPEFSGTIAFLRGVTTRGGKPQDFITNLQHLEGARKRASALGYALDTFLFPFDGSEDRILHRILISRGITGLIIYPPEGDQFRLSFDFSDFCPVCFGSNIRHPTLHRVMGNQTHSVKLALEKIHERGYSRPGLSLYRRADINTNHEWLPAFLTFQFFQRTKDRIPILFWEDFSEKSEALFMQWFRKHQPDVLIAQGPMEAYWLGRHGLQSPRDFSYVNLTVKPGDAIQTGTLEEPEMAGSLMVDMVVAQIHRNERGLPELAKESLVEARWVDGPDLPVRRTTS